MAEFTPIDHTPGEGGGGGKKKLKFDKKQKMLMLGGGIAVVLVALFMSKAKGSGSSKDAVDEELKDYYTNYPTLGNQNSVVQDGMNTLVGRQEEINNALLEAMGKKPPSELTQMRSGDYASINDAVKMQNFLVANGISSSVVDHYYVKDGYEGSRDYYFVKGFSADKDLINELSNKVRQEKLSANIYTQQVQSKDAPNSGSNFIQY